MSTAMSYYSKASSNNHILNFLSISSYSPQYFPIPHFIYPSDSLSCSIAFQMLLIFSFLAIPSSKSCIPLEEFRSCFQIYTHSKHVSFLRGKKEKTHLLPLSFHLSYFHVCYTTGNLIRTKIIQSHFLVVMYNPYVS